MRNYFGDGYKAFVNGKARADNPYHYGPIPVGTPPEAWLDWDAGWVAAKLAAQDLRRLVETPHNKAVAAAVGGADS